MYTAAYVANEAMLKRGLLLALQDLLWKSSRLLAEEWFKDEVSSLSNIDGPEAPSRKKNKFNEYKLYWRRVFSNKLPDSLKCTTFGENRLVSWLNVLRMSFFWPLWFFSRSSDLLTGSTADGIAKSWFSLIWLCSLWGIIEWPHEASSECELLSP